MILIVLCVGMYASWRVMCSIMPDLDLNRTISGVWRGQLVNNIFVHRDNLLRHVHDRYDAQHCRRMHGTRS